jgi:hypothetical protein
MRAAGAVAEPIAAGIARARERLLSALARWNVPPDGRMGEPWTAGVAAFWTVALLALCLLFYYLA